MYSKLFWGANINKKLLILSLMIIFIASIGCVTAQDMGGNSTFTSSENGSEHVSSPDGGEDDSGVLSVSNSNESKSNVVTSSYLVLDNDADKENIHIGDKVIWILSVINLGPDTAKNVKVFDKLPDGLKYVSYFATKGTFNPETGLWDIGDLKVEDGPEMLWITTKALTTGEKVNKANLTTDSINLNNETYEEEEIDVLDDDSDSSYDNHAIKTYETGNPILLMLIALLGLFYPIKRLI